MCVNRQQECSLPGSVAALSGLSWGCRWVLSRKAAPPDSPHTQIRPCAACVGKDAAHARPLAQAVCSARSSTLCSCRSPRQGRHQTLPTRLYSTYGSAKLLSAMTACIAQAENEACRAC